MNIIVNAAFDTNLKVGISLYIQKLLPYLAKQCNLTILTPDPHLFSNYGKTILLPNFVRYNLRRTLWTLMGLNSQLKQHKAILFSPTPAVPIFPRIPVIAVVYDLTPLIIRRSITAKEKLFFWLGIQSLKFADYLITVSNHTKRDLKRFNLVPTERIVVAWAGPGVSPSNADTDFGKRFSPYILYVGSHSAHKNLARLIAAFSLIRKKRDIRLILVGKGNREQLRETQLLIIRYNLRSQILLFEELNENQLSSLYRHCQLLVCPSIYEGFGLPVLEAMAHGAPVACSKTSSLPEVAGDAGVFFNPFSVQDITQKIQLLLDQPELRKKLIENGLARANLFRWEKTAQTILECAHRIQS
ncbi:MAG: glycosyltransferase family 4 protein [bacterium]